MTEQEAGQKRCCGPEGCGVLGNPDYEGGPSSRWCIGSACMAWRWELTDRGWRVLQTKGLDALLQEAAPNKLQGHCGLAGTP